MTIAKHYIGLILLLATGIAQAQKPVFTTAKTNTVTVYYNGAEMTQGISTTLTAGSNEIVVKNVADFVNENTVQVSAPNNVTVLSVQFTKNYMNEYDKDETSPALKTVRDSIETVKKEIARTESLKNNEGKTMELLDQNRQVSGQNTGLSVAELMKLTDYYKTKINELSANWRKLNEQSEKLNKILGRLNDRLNTNTPKQEKTSQGKLVLQVMADQAGTFPMEITYLTQGAQWTPFYDLRTDNTSGPISMMYKAQVTQNTGVDWKQVKLTLSSGTPNQSSQIPELNPWFLVYGNTIYGRPNATFVQTLQGQAPGLNITQGSGQPSADSNIRIRGYASEAVTTVAKKDISNYTSINDGQMNVSFVIDVPYDVASNNKAHSVRMKEIKLPATYRHYAVPKMEQDAFLMADVTDYSKYNLLPGEANIIFDGMYIGKTTINPNQTADTLNLSMGRDKRLSVKREKVVDKSGTKFLSGYREQTFTYETTIRNNKKDAVTLMLKDQYPISTDKDIEITLLKDDGAKVNSETGVLTWELKVNPGETKKVRISYKVRYPKDKVIANL